MGPRSALALAAVPVLALTAGLPFANRLEPLVLGLPFLLFWMLAWVLLTPVFLAAAYFVVHRGRPSTAPIGKAEASPDQPQRFPGNAAGRTPPGSPGRGRGGRS